MKKHILKLRQHFSPTFKLLTAINANTYGDSYQKMADSMPDGLPPAGRKEQCRGLFLKVFRKNRSSEDKDKNRITFHWGSDT